MATTPIYTFTTPDLTGTADGPAGMAALAQRVEREMPTVRATNEYDAEPNSVFGSSTSNNLIMNASVPTSVIGWMELHAMLTLAENGGSGNDITTQAFSGFIRLLADGNTLRTYRYHSLWGTRTLTLSMYGVIARTAANTTTAVELRLDIDAGLGVSVNHYNVLATQIGAPGTG